MSKLATFRPTIFLVSIATQICISTSYNVVDFGAISDGKTNSTSAFIKAWTAACNSNEESTVIVPLGKFLVNSISFNGPCKNKMKVQILGNIVAPNNYKSLTNHQAWIGFYRVSKLSVVGGGTIDAKGSTYWSCKTGGKNTCPYNARSFSLQSCDDVLVNGLTSFNSQGVHIHINGCNNITMQNLKLIAPANSPNTDGIHIGNSKAFRVFNSTIATGDDCISIGPGSIDMKVEKIHCGPGHGIRYMLDKFNEIPKSRIVAMCFIKSYYCPRKELINKNIGSMGGNPTEDGVEQIVVTDSVFISTDNGVRIKTWAKPSNSYTRNIVFENLKMENVANPIIIDQQYCPQKNCPNASSGVKVSNVTFNNIKGSSRTQEAVTLLCSSTKPCEKIKLQNINLSYINQLKKVQQRAISQCQNAKVTIAGVVSPKC